MLFVNMVLRELCKWLLVNKNTKSSTGAGKSYQKVYVLAALNLSASSGLIKKIYGLSADGCLFSLTACSECGRKESLSFFFCFFFFINFFQFAIPAILA